MKKKPPEPEQKHHPPGGGGPPNPPGGGPPGGGHPDNPSATNVLLMKMIALQQDMNALMLEMQKEIDDISDDVAEIKGDVKECGKELKEIGKDIEEIDENVEEILKIVKEILVLVTPPDVTGFTLTQILKEISMPITGVPAGSVGTFQVGLVPPSGVLQSGPTVTSADTSGLITLGALDMTTLQFTAAVDATYTLPTFIVNVAGTNSAGAVSADFVIPVPAAPPVDVTDFTLDQVGSAKKK